MSRIGSKPIEIPENVEIESNQGSILVKGPKGSIEIRIDNSIEIKLEDNLVMLERKNDEPSVRSLHGLYRSLIYNNIVGVTEGFTKTLELQGVGFKAILKGNDLELSILDIANKIIQLSGSKSSIKYLNSLPDDPIQRRPDLSLANRESQ